MPERTRRARSWKAIAGRFAEPLSDREDNWESDGRSAANPLAEMEVHLTRSMNSQQDPTATRDVPVELDVSEVTRTARQLHEGVVVDSDANKIVQNQ